MNAPAVSARTDWVPHWLRVLADLAATLILWCYFTVGFVLFFAPLYVLAAVAARDRPRAFQRINHIFYRGFFLLCRVVLPRQRWRIDPALKQVHGAVVVCNHLSYIDPLLLIATFARHTTIVKSRLLNIPIFGWMLRLSGYLPDVSQGRLAGRMVALMEAMPGFLSAGGNLIIFPEGTRSRTGAMGTLNPGAFKIARLCRAPVAVAAIENSDRLFTPGRFRFNACRANTISLTLLSCLTPDYDSPHFSTRKLIDQIGRLFASRRGQTAEHPGDAFVFIEQRAEEP